MGGSFFVFCLLLTVVPCLFGVAVFLLVSVWFCCGGVLLSFLLYPWCLVGVVVWRVAGCGLVRNLGGCFLSMGSSLNGWPARYRWVKPHVILRYFAMGK